MRDTAVGRPGRTRRHRARSYQKWLYQLRRVSWKRPANARQKAVSFTWYDHRLMRWGVLHCQSGWSSEYRPCTFVELRAHRKEFLDELLPEGGLPYAFHHEVNVRSTDPHNRGLLNEKRRFSSQALGLFKLTQNDWTLDSPIHSFSAQSIAATAPFHTPRHIPTQHHVGIRNCREPAERRGLCESSWRSLGHGARGFGGGRVARDAGEQGRDSFRDVEELGCYCCSCDEDPLQQQVGVAVSG